MNKKGIIEYSLTTKNFREYFTDFGMKSYTDHLFMRVDKSHESLGFLSKYEHYPRYSKRE